MILPSLGVWKRLPDCVNPARSKGLHSSAKSARSETYNNVSNKDDFRTRDFRILEVTYELRGPTLCVWG